MANTPFARALRGLPSGRQGLTFILTLNGAKTVWDTEAPQSNNQAIRGNGVKCSCPVESQEYWRATFCSASSFQQASAANKASPRCRPKPSTCTTLSVVDSAEVLSSPTVRQVYWQCKKRNCSTESRTSWTSKKFHWHGAPQCDE